MLAEIEACLEDAPKIGLGQEVADIMERTGGLDHTAVLLVTSDRKLVPLGISREDLTDKELERGLHFVAENAPPLGHGITGWVAVAGESVCVGDVLGDPRYVAINDDINSELCVPVRLEGHTIGVLNAESTRWDAYEDADRVELEAVAERIAAALEESRVAHRARATERALELAKHARDGFVTLCAVCRRMRVRSDWVRTEPLVLRALPVPCSHGLCSHCVDELAQQDSVSLS